MVMATFEREKLEKKVIIGEKHPLKQLQKGDRQGGGGK